MYEFIITSKQADTVATGITNLTVSYGCLAGSHFQPIARYLADNRISKCEFLSVYSSRIAADTIYSSVNIDKVQWVLIAGGMEANTIPLTRQTVVGEVRKHFISTVAPEYNGSIKCTFCHKLSMYLYTWFTMEIKACSGSKSKPGTFFYAQTIINNDRAGWTD